MTKLLALAALLEAATGVALMIDPSLVVRLLLGEGVSGPALALGRVGGFGLFSLGLACWQQTNPPGSPAIAALFAYNMLVTIYFLYLGIGGEWVGILLWPAVLLHGMVTLLLVGWWLRNRHRKLL
jgi:hypothetical protein